jgi:hypothetical protein
VITGAVSSFSLPENPMPKFSIDKYRMIYPEHRIQHRNRQILIALLQDSHSIV